MKIQSQLCKLHLYNALFSFRITDAVWVVFLLSRGFSLAQVGLAEGIFHITGFLCEVPSGMAADLLGRRRTLAVSGLFGVLSALAMAFSTGFAGVCLSMVFSALSYNLNSGTQSAITYDSLLMAGRAGDYLKVNAWLDGISRIVSALSCLVGGLALWLGFFRAYLVGAILFGAVATLALLLVEPVVTLAQQQRTQNPFANLLPRLWEHSKASWGFLRCNPRTACRILANAGVAVPIYLTFMYQQQHLVDSGLNALWLGAALLAVRLAGSAGVVVGVRWRIPLFRLGMVCALGAGLGTMVAGVQGLWLLSTLGAMAASLFEGMMQLRMEAALNDDFPSDQRATLISVDSMAYSMLMVVVSPLSGMAGDLLGTGFALVLLGGGLVVCALAAGALAAHSRRR